MNIKTKRILVTGAGGFIGSHLVERLINLGIKTRAFVRYVSSGNCGWLDESPVRQDIEIFRGDITDALSVRQSMKSIDVVFHLAALIGIPYSYHAPFSYLQTNIEGTLNILQAALESETHVIYISTSEVYGTPLTIPISEEHPLQAQSPYSATKIAAEKIAESFYRAFQLPVTIIRPFNTYGPRQSGRAIIPTIMIQALRDSEIRLGNPYPTRDFTYVSDTVEGIIKAAENPEHAGKIFNLGTNKEISISELVKKISALLDMQLKIVSDKQRQRRTSSEVERLKSDYTKASQLLGYKPIISLDEGLAKYLDWLKLNLNRYNTNYAI